MKPNPYIELVEKWRANKDAVTKEELLASKEAAINACDAVDAACDAVEAALNADPGGVDYFIKRYHDLTA